MFFALHGPLLQFTSIFIAMFLEAAPFLLLGSLVASLVEEYVSPEWIAARFSGGPIKGVLLGLFGGMIVPTCECGVVPVVRRLIGKGVPPHAAVTGDKSSGHRLYPGSL